jgi:hypothetical protein
MFHDVSHKRKPKLLQVLWYMPIILDTQKMEIGKIAIPDQPGEKVRRLHLNQQAGHGGFVSVIPAIQEAKVGGGDLRLAWTKTRDPIWKNN